MFVDGRVGAETLDLWHTHFLRVLFIVEEDEAFDLVAAGLLGAVRVVFSAQGLPHAVQELRRRRGWL